MKHWVYELDEFGNSLQILRLVEEAEELRAERARLAQEIERTETRILELVTRCWSRDEITAAKNKFMKHNWTRS